MDFESEIAALVDILEAIPAAGRIERLMLFSTANTLVDFISASAPDQQQKHARQKLGEFLEDLGKATIPSEVFGMERILEEARIDLNVAKVDFSTASRQAL